MSENATNIVFITARWYRAAELLLGKKDYDEKIVIRLNQINFCRIFGLQDACYSK
jgi:hypothetical protein